MDANLPDTAVVWGLRVLYAAGILIGGLWLAFFLSRFVRRQVIKHPRIDRTLGTFLALIIRYAIIGFVIVAVLQKFGVETTSLVAVLGAGALAVGLALQGTLGNVASGMMIAFMRPYRIGDFIEINGKQGRVVDLDLFFTEILSPDASRILVPNGQAMANPIINFTVKGKRRCIIVIGISYEDDIDEAFRVMREIMTGDSRAKDEPPAWFGVDALGDFSVNISGRVWVATEDHRTYRADMLKAVKEAFDREGIEMPYPHAVELSKGELTPRMPPVKPPPAPEAHEAPEAPLARKAGSRR